MGTWFKKIKFVRSISFFQPAVLLSYCSLDRSTTNAMIFTLNLGKLKKNQSNCLILVEMLYFYTDKQWKKVSDYVFLSLFYEFPQ